MSNTNFASNVSTQGTGYGTFQNELFAPRDPVTLSLMKRVAPASRAVPSGAIMTDGSINFQVPSWSPNVHCDERGRIIGIISFTGKVTTLAYNLKNELVTIKQSDGNILEKRKGAWFDGKGVMSSWTEIVALQDGTLWCKRKDGIIVNKNVDETTTVQNVAQRYLLWFDDREHLTAIRYPNGQSRSFAYDINGLCAMIEPDGSRFFMQNGKWHSDADSGLSVDELRVVKDGTVIYKVGNDIIATTASGKVKRVTLAEGDAGYQRPCAIAPHSLVSQTSAPLVVQKDNHENCENSGQPEADGTRTLTSLTDPSLKSLLERRNLLQRALMNCPLDSADIEDTEENQYACGSSHIDQEPLNLHLYRIHAQKDLPLSKRLDLAAAEVSNYLFGTFPVAVIRMTEQKGEIERAIVKEISEASAQWFDRKVWSLVSIVKNEDCEQELVNSLNRNPEFRVKLEQAAVERLIVGGSRAGDPEPHFAIRPSGSSYQIVNDKVEGTFDPEVMQPQWENVSEGPFKLVFDSLSGIQLSPETLTRIASFLNYFDCPDGKEYLSNFGLYDDEIDCLIARARWFAEQKRLPRCC